MARIMSSVGTRIERFSEAQFAYIMLLPAFLLTGVLAFWPILWTFDMSLHADTLGTQLVGQFVGLENYINILTKSAFLNAPFYDFSQPFQGSLTVTFIIVIGTVSLSVIIGFVEAVVLNKAFQGRSVLRVAAILPWAVPIVIQGMIFRLMFTPGVGFGPIVMDWIGLSNSGAPLADSVEGTIIVILAETWRWSAFSMIIILAGLQSIDRDLYRVGKVTGATRWERFKMITFPLLLPTLLIVLIFRTIDALRVYGAVAATTGCSTVPSLACSAIQAFSNSQYGTSSALAVILAAIVMVFVLIYALYYKYSSNAELEI